MAKPQAVRPGYYVAIALEPGMAPADCYIGLVVAADEYGVRINLVRWDHELDVVVRETEDLFLPWVSINSMLVCNEDQPSRRFLVQRAPAWQADIEKMYGMPQASKQGKDRESKKGSS